MIKINTNSANEIIFYCKNFRSCMCIYLRDQELYILFPVQKMASADEYCPLSFLSALL